PRHTLFPYPTLFRSEPDDFVVATGDAHSVAEMVELAFAEAGLDWRRHVEIDPRYLRPTEVAALCGDAAKARDRLGWQPRIGFERSEEHTSELQSPDL